MDRNEAKQVLKRCRKDKPLDDLYDSVLIPALSLAEQDRHRNEIDEATETFVCQSIKEFVEEINDRSHEQRELDAKDTDEVASSDASPSPPQKRTANRAGYVVCMPVGDEADEIIGTMLAHLLERAGYRTHSLAIGTSVEMLAQVSKEKPDIVCLSALPPFAVGHARVLYQRLRAQSPDLKIVIGLWTFAGDPKRAATRIGGVAGTEVSRTLAHAMQQVNFLTDAATQPAVQSSS
jgi:CheY-like chemotaxis protein